MGNLNLQECQPTKAPPLHTISGPSVELPEMASLHGAFLKLVQNIKQHDRRTDIRSPTRKKTAVICDNDTLSFGQLDRLSDALMSVLSDMLERCPPDAVDHHHRVAVHMEPSLNLIVVLFAILKLKAAIVPLDPSLSTERISYIISDAKPSFIICDDPQQLQEFSADIVVVEAEKLLEIARQPCRHFACPVFHINDQNLPAVILYTSGYPGKSVILSHRLIMNRIIWQWTELPFQDEEMGLLINALTATAGLLEIFATLLAGRTLLIDRSKILNYPSNLFSVLQKYPIRRITVVPSFLRYICDYLDEEGKIFYGPLEMVMVTGEAMSYTLAHRFYNHFTQTKLANFYSLTEASGDVMWMIFDNKTHFENACMDGIVPVGKVINNFIITVIDENLHPAMKKGWGELAISSHLIPTSNRDTFQLLGDAGRLWHRTGDLTYINSASGLIYVKGRMADQVRIGGKRFHLSEIEDLLKQIPSIRDAAVVKLNDDVGNCKKIYAFYYSGGTGDNVDDLAAHKAKKSVRCHLPSYAQPSFVRCDAPFPMLANGKIDRMKLFNMFEEKVHGWENIDVPTPLTTIASVLGKPVGTIDLDRSFTENGGTSLNTVDTIIQLGKCGFKLTLADFLSATTVREIIARCEWTPPSVSPPSADSPGQPEFNTLQFSAPVREQVVALLIAAVAGEPSEFSEEYPRLTAGELRRIAEQFFDEVAGAGESVGVFCFAVKSGEQVVAVTAAYDIHGSFAETQTLFTGQPGPVAQLMQNAMMPLFAGIPQKPGIIVRNFLMTTDASLSSQQSIALFNFMEVELENRAKYSGFQYVVTVNSNRTRQQLAELRGAERWAAYQANRLALRDGSVPLSEAADTLKITVDVCTLSRKNNENIECLLSDAVRS